MSRISGSGAMFVAAITSLSCAVVGGASWAGVVAPELISISSVGAAAEESSFGSTVSSSGRYIAFTSNASNLVEGDTNGLSDVFVRDRQSGQTERVSVDSGGTEGDAASRDPALSGGGRFVAFSSWAALVPADTNDHVDAYVHDRVTDQTHLVSVDRDGLATARGSSRSVVDISSDGRYVAFVSRAANLTPEKNGHAAIYVRDLVEGVTELVTVNRRGNAANHVSYAPSLSADGRYVAFFSGSTNLAGASESNQSLDVFVRDRQAATTRLVSVGRHGDPADRDSLFASISNDGHAVAFSSAATNLVAGDTDQNFDVFVRNMTSKVTKIVSVRTNGAQARRPSTRPVISPDGSFVAFTSEATLVGGETNDAPDAYLWDRGSKVMQLVSANPIEFHEGDACYANGVSRNGTYVSFQSSGAVFDTRDTNYSHSDIYLLAR